MKSLLILPTLFALTGQAHADDTNNYRDNHDNYHTYTGTYENKRARPAPPYSDEPRYLKLLQIIDDRQRDITIRANLIIQDSLKSDELES